MTIGNWRQRLLDKENLKLVDVIKSFKNDETAHAQSETLNKVATKVNVLMYKKKTNKEGYNKDKKKKYAK